MFPPSPWTLFTWTRPSIPTPPTTSSSASAPARESPAQIKAFTDTWEWTQETEYTYEIDIIQNPAVPSGGQGHDHRLPPVHRGSNAMMAYLVMMAPRLVELHRVLKPTGSLYLHCDPTASHYLKLLLDAVFGSGMFSERNQLATFGF